MMNMKSVFVVLVLLGMAFAGLSVPSTSVSQETFKPGANGVVTIVVASSETSEKLITGISLEVDAPPEITITGDQYIGDLEPGGSTSVSLPFKVKDTAKSSVYNVRVDITGVSDRVTGGYDIFTRRLTVPVTVVDAPIISFSTDDQVLTGIEDIQLTVTNNGGPASNLRVSVPESSSIALYGSDEIFIDDISDQGVAIDLSLDSRNAADGPVDLPLSFKYEDELGIEHSETSKLRVTVRNEKLDLTITQKSDIITRQETQLTLEISNDGTEYLEDVRLSFPEDGIKLKDENEYKFGDLAPGQTTSLSVLAFSDLAPGVNLVNADVEWIERDVQKESTINVPVTVASDADIGVYLEAKPLPLTIGAEHTISVLVSNLGSFNIENVDVMLSSSALKGLDISDKQYIGGLQRDDFSTVQFLMNVNATEPGTYPAYITVNYRDLSGEWKQKTLKEEITVYNGVVTDESPLPLLLGLGVIAVLVWYFKLRKPAKK